MKQPIKSLLLSTAAAALVFATSTSYAASCTNDTWNKIINKSCRKDYDEWVERWIYKIADADEKGDMRAIHEGARTLAGKSKNFQYTQPTKNKEGKLI